MKPQARGVLLTLGGVVVLSPDGLLIRLVEADPASLLFWRGLFLGLAIAAAYLLRGGIAAALRATGAAGLLAATVFAASTIMFVNSIERTTVASTLVIISAAPLLAALLSAWLLREPVPVRTWMATGGLALGLLVIFAGSLGGGTLLGDLLAFGTAATMAVYLVLFRWRREVDMAPAIGLGGLLAALVCLPFAEPLVLGARDLALLFVLGALVQAGSFLMIAAAPRYLPAAEVGLILLLEAVLGPLWVWLAIGEAPAGETVAGGLVILAAIAWNAAPRNCAAPSRRRILRRQEEEPPTAGSRDTWPKE